MSRRDRDRSFEKALARNFPNAPGHSAAGLLCPDPETLAAYHENTLAPQELLSWKQHFAACSRCQELLKHLGATDNIVLQALQPLEAGKPAALGAAAAYSHTVIEARRSRLGLNWANYWRWAVPAGALAAGLLVWMAVRQTQSPKVEMAKNQKTAPVTQPAQETARAATASPAPRNLGAPGPAASREADRAPEESSSEIFDRIPAADASKTSGKGAPEKRGAPEANAQRIVPPATAAHRRDQNAAGAHSASEPERTGNSLYRHGLERPVVKPRGVERGLDSGADLRQGPAAMSAGAPALPKMTQSVIVTTPETTSAEAMEGKALAAIGGTLPEGRKEFQSARGVNSRVGFRKASAQSPALILAPEGRVLWRVGMAGMIERSADGGRSWVVQKSGVAADLLAGSAVSDEVCWIIGRAGTILRTTDGGTHWLKLPSPSAQDLAAVRATDAQQAVILDASNQRTYKTTDGGTSWTQLPAE